MMMASSSAGPDSKVAQAPFKWVRFATTETVTKVAFTDGDDVDTFLDTAKRRFFEKSGVNAFNLKIYNSKEAYDKKHELGNEAFPAGKKVAEITDGQSDTSPLYVTWDEPVESRPAGGRGTAPATIDNFKAMLATKGIQRPKPDVISRIVQRYSRRLEIIGSDACLAEELYAEVKALPGTTTACKVRDDLGLSLDGAFELNDRLIKGVWCKERGTWKKGQPVLVKLNVTEEELDFAQFVKEQKIPNAIDSEGVKLFQDGREVMALVMPHYVTTVGRMAKMGVEVIVAGVSRIQAALEAMHAHRLVHCDVKPENIFVDGEGRWFLGDFGSTVKVGHRGDLFCTDIFLPSDQNPRAETVTDWYMLLATTVALLNALRGSSDALVAFTERLSTAELHQKLQMYLPDATLVKVCDKAPKPV